MEGVVDGGRRVRKDWMGSLGEGRSGLTMTLVGVVGVWEVDEGVLDLEVGDEEAAWVVSRLCWMVVKRWGWMLAQ